MNRVDGMLVVEVNGADINQNPDTGYPRVDPLGMGVVTGVSVKRKIRDLLDDKKGPFWAALGKKFDLDPAEFAIFETRNRGFDDAKDGKDAKNRALKLMYNSLDEFLHRYYDVRVFGATPLDGDDKDIDRSKVFISTGPLTFSNGKTVAKVMTVSNSLTKKAPLREKLIIKDSGDIAPAANKYIDHGVYVISFSINPQIAHRTGMTSKDVEVIKATIPYMYSLTTSCFRPSSSIQMLHAWWAEHKNPIGSFNWYKVKQALMPRKDNKEPSSSLDEYHIPQADDIDKSLLNGCEIVDVSNPQL